MITLYKKLLLTAITLLLTVSFCFAGPPESKPVVFDTAPPGTDKKVIGIFLEAPMTYVNNETVRVLVPAKAKEKLPTTVFTILPFEKTEMALRTYKEDNRMVVNQYYSQPLNRSDIQKISKELGAEYALFIIVSNDAPRVGAGLFSMTFRTTVTCDVRLLHVESGKYITSKQIVKDGSSTAIYMGVPSFENAYREALEKALSELTVDISQI